VEGFKGALRPTVTVLRELVMTPTKESRSFRGATELAHDSARAGKYLEDVRAACEAGDKVAAKRALRLAINELETAHSALQIGLD
jgi:hypothetical protein